MTQTRPAQASDQRPVALPLSTARLPSEVTWSPDGSTLVADWNGERIEVRCYLFDDEAHPADDSPVLVPTHPLHDSMHAALEDHQDTILESLRYDRDEALADDARDRREWLES
jgi:hypothetical protein